MSILLTNSNQLDWKIIPEIEKALNEERYELDYPQWRFDCGFKLDFDGGLIRASSRFYPIEEGWAGAVDIMILDKVVQEYPVEAKTLQELKLVVEQYINTVIDKLRKFKL